MIFFKDIVGKRSLLFSDHAKERAEEIGLREEDAATQLYLSQETFYSNDFYFAKEQKYGRKYKNIKYFLAGDILFTTRFFSDKVLIITIHDMQKHEWF